MINCSDLNFLMIVQFLSAKDSWTRNLYQTLIFFIDRVTKPISGLDRRPGMQDIMTLDRKKWEVISEGNAIAFARV